MPPKAKTTAKTRVVSVLVPWRETAERAPLWAFLRELWAARHPDWQLVEGACPDGPWRKGVAVADALSRADGDVLVVADADVWCDGVADAVAALSNSVRWAIPHHRVLRLTKSATAEAVESGGWPTVRTSFTYAQRPYVGYPGGGLVVLPREMYDEVPIDPRFAGWGQEDESWALALRVLGGREWRGTADLWHLWHAPQPRQSRFIGSTASRLLWRRYYAARDGVRMRALIAEARQNEAVSA